MQWLGEWSRPGDKEDDTGSDTDSSGDDATATGVARPFHELDYTWDFGDATSGVWQTTGYSKNTSVGAVAAHVFETPGTHNLTVRVTNGTDVRRCAPVSQICAVPRFQMRRLRACRA